MQVIFILAFWWAVGFVTVGLRILCSLCLGAHILHLNRGERRARAGFALMHLAYMLLIVWFVFLYQFLSDRDLIYEPGSGKRTVSYSERWAGSWIFTLAVAHVIIYVGIAERQELRRRQIATDRVWTRSASLGGAGTSVVQHQVDIMTDEEIIRKVSSSWIS
jgi:hypothetical protein